MTERISIKATLRPGQLYFPSENGVNAALFKINSGRFVQRSGINSSGSTKFRGSNGLLVVLLEGGQATGGLASVELPPV